MSDTARGQAAPITERDGRALLRRFERLQLHVRCGLSPDLPGCVRLYVHAGQQIARCGLRPAAEVQLRLLNTLLRTGQDEALPWFWRSVCLEQLSQPLAALGSSIGLHDPIALQAIEAAVQRARDRLPAVPPPHQGPRPGCRGASS